MLMIRCYQHWYTIGMKSTVQNFTLAIRMRTIL